VYAKAKYVSAAQAAPEGAGDDWRWAAMDAATKPVAAWMANDGLRAYRKAVEERSALTSI
jgi:hypothetical protein